jgi:hypothetical protein
VPNKSALASNLPKTNVDSGTSSADAKEDDPCTVREVPSPRSEVQEHDSVYLWDAVDDVTDSMICQLSTAEAQNQVGGSEAVEAADDFHAASDEHGEGHSSSDHLWQEVDQISFSAICELDIIDANNEKEMGIGDGEISSTGESENCLGKFVLLFLPENTAPSTLRIANFQPTDAGGELETSVRRLLFSVITQIRITIPYSGVWQVVFTMYTSRRSLCTSGLV